MRWAGRQLFMLWLIGMTCVALAMLHVEDLEWQRRERQRRAHD